MDLGRNLESIRRQAGHWAPQPLVEAGAERAVKETLLSWLPPGAYEAVTEIGLSENCGALARSSPEAAATYHGFDRREEARARAARLAIPGATLKPLPEGAELPLPKASQDLFLSLFTLERLRMDELYMAIAEMKRITKPGAYAALASLHPGDSWWERIVSSFHARAGRGTPLQLAHYLSPEDWDTVREGKQSLGRGRVAGLVVLRRRTDEPL
jgi:hypothetical protein